MRLFVDASALTSMLARESDADMLGSMLQVSADRVTSAFALWEAARALAKFGRGDMAQGLAEANRFCGALKVAVVSIGEEEVAGAVAAQMRYGKGSGHPARLNMGDCFAYACAKTNGARLLYKGDDFAHTDLA